MLKAAYDNNICMMEHRPELGTQSTRRLAIAVRGVVQGVGFRPFVYNAARARGLAGWVLNEAGAVRIEVQGGDWCKEHNRPESQCFLCNPKLADKFAAEYVAKYGKKPPKSEEK